MNRHALESALLQFTRQYLREIGVKDERISDKEILDRIRRTFKDMPESDVRHA